MLFVAQQYTIITNNDDIILTNIYHLILRESLNRFKVPDVGELPV